MYWNRKKTYCVSHKKDLLKSKSHEYNFCYGEITRKWSSIVEIMKYFVMYIVKIQSWSVTFFYGDDEINIFHKLHLQLYLIDLKKKLSSRQK